MSRRTILLALLVVAACDAPRPSPTPPPAASASPVAVESHDPPVTSSPAPSVVSTPPTATELITAAVLAGEIDEPTGYLYRFYARWGDPRLPEAYRGLPSEDLALAMGAEAALDSYSPEDQALLRPFVVRPTHPESYWTADPVSQSPESAATSVRTVRVALLANDPRCTDGVWARRDMVNIPVTLWARCRQHADGATELGIVDAMNRAARLLTLVWTDMVGLMGLPIPDRFAGGNQGPNEVPEAGDGRLDVYLTEAPNVSYGRNLDVSASGAAVYGSAPDDPATGSSASYIVMDVNRRPSATDQEATMAHELFHVLQNTHNRSGAAVCPYPSTAAASTCAAVATNHWFVEASAMWAVHEFLPTHRWYVYDDFEVFRTTMLPLASTAGENEYRSFMWPLFMEQETLRGAGIVGDAWDALEGKFGWVAIQAALDSQLSFTTEFREFAVRVWNEELLEGDPISPRFQHPNLDEAFPTKTPGDDPDPVRFLGDEVLVPDSQERFTVDLPELWAGYYLLSLPPNVGRLTLNFAGLNPNSELDVDALVNIRDVGWERRKLDPGVTEWCLDKPADAVQDVILVLSNHSQTPTTHVKGDWTALASLGGCSTASDSLVYTSFYEYGSRDTVYGSTQETLTLRVSLKSSSTGFGLEDAGSTFRGSVDTQGFIAGLPGSGCNLVSEGHGGGGGPIPVDMGGGISGGMYEAVIEPPFGSTAPPQRRFELVISASVPIEVTNVEESCIGSGTSSTIHIIQLPQCEGTEVEDTPAGILFDFNCSFTGPNLSWTLVGKIRVAT